ncbi:MAG TPA: hypothetical protein VGQ08_13235 [Nitrospiraceae bacterium]|jgi:hypothetical protein|nr:hypothetical protein [Nitrospiraceae bacterium]
MSNKSYRPTREKEQEEQRELEQKVLALFKKCGPLVSMGLYFLFDPNHTADAQPVLQSLREQGYIEVTQDMMVTITVSGLKRLEDKEY